MKRIAYITQLEAKLGGGGSYAVNWHVQDQLSKYFSLHTPPPIKPIISPIGKFRSRVNRRILKRPGDFFYFSLATLDNNASRVSKALENDLDAVFFRSATSWCHCRPGIPYFVYLDVVFQTFFDNTFSRNDFVESDLERIFNSEAGFLENATAVFFESDWGMKKAKEAYSLVGEHYFVTGRGGVVESPANDSWREELLILLSIAMRFEQKGGDLTLEAFKALQKTHPDIRWHIVGGKPSDDCDGINGIVYEGPLDPGNEKDLERFRKLLSSAFVLLHPTREDTNPLVITEAAYFGCPSISVNRFAIPELVIHGKTGVLLDGPIQPSEIKDAIIKMINDPISYREMRKEARRFALERFQWDGIGSRMNYLISATLEDDGR
ncbi:glycosyltransferase family 4 protein [Pseudomonadota bacterium]